MWGFIWLIKASSFWEISQRTWIKLPYLCTGATLGSAKAALHSVDCGGKKVLIYQDFFFFCLCVPLFDFNEITLRNCDELMFRIIV